MSGAQVFQEVARIVGQMALQMQTQRVSRDMLIGWADALRRAADALQKMAERQR